MNDTVHSQPQSRPETTAETVTSIDICYPPTGAMLPQFFTAWGTLPAGMYVSACYFQCGSTRRGAHTIVAMGGGRWFATFTDVPACDGSGRLTVEGKAVSGTLTQTDYSDKLSVFDVSSSGEPGPHPLQVHLNNPGADASVHSSFTASGTADGIPRTTVTRCFFSCPGDSDVDVNSLHQDPPPGKLWSGNFDPAPLCTDGTVTVLGADGSQESHGNITVTA